MVWSPKTKAKRNLLNDFIWRKSTFNHAVFLMTSIFSICICVFSLLTQECFINFNLVSHWIKKGCRYNKIIPLKLHMQKAQNSSYLNQLLHTYVWEHRTYIQWKFFFGLASMHVCLCCYVNIIFRIPNSFLSECSKIVCKVSL